MVDAFFDEVYPCSVFGFLQRAEFYESFDTGTTLRGLLLAVCSLSLKYLLDNPEEQSRMWVSEAKALAMRDIDQGEMTLATLSTLILCFHQELFHRAFGAAWMTSGTIIRLVPKMKIDCGNIYINIFARLAFALRLNLTTNAPPPGTKQISWSDGEYRRRLMWAVYVIDMYVCDGFPEYSNVPRSSLRIQLPCDEESYASNCGYDAGTLMLPEIDTGQFLLRPTLHPRSASSSLAQYVLIFSIRTEILS